MIKNILLLAGVMFLITGCAGKELQRSASNKLFDTKGFDKSKRKPIYNDKYIDRAKRNVSEHNYDDDDFSDADEPDEYVDPYTQNRIMYSNMIRNDKKKRKNDSYPDIGHARDLAKMNNDSNSNADLRKELDDIKNMLSSAKKDLAKYKCPLQEPVEVEKPRKVKKAALPVPAKQEEPEDLDLGDDIDTNADHSATIDPVAHHVNPPAEHHPTPSPSNIHEVSEALPPAHIAPTSAPLPAGALPMTPMPAVPHTKSQGSPAPNNDKKDMGVIIPSAPGSDHGMMNVAPGK